MKIVKQTLDWSFSMRCREEKKRTLLDSITITEESKEHYTERKIALKIIKRNLFTDNYHQTIHINHPSQLLKCLTDHLLANLVSLLMSTS